ncbi:MAG: SRPBCC domain-containing protein [Alphaproteobacteria bacterium]
MSARILVALRVAASPARAFAAFTDEIGQWWRPNAMFAFTRGEPGRLSFERSADGTGRLIETKADGSVFVIGRITAWEPGERLAFSWRQASFGPGQDTQVEVRFEAVGAETRVSVEHLGWDGVPQEHVARHRFPDAIFLQRHGEWWQAQLTALKRRLA